MLAIVIPYYKIEFFEECLASLAMQTNDRFNVYIGNDQSPDNPKELIASYSKHLNIVYKEFDENLGMVSLTQQWERCLALVQEEEWISLLGDDDILGENCVMEFYKLLEEGKTRFFNVLRFSSQVINAKGEEISRIYTHPEQENSKDFIFRKLMGYTRSSLSEYIFRKENMCGFHGFPLAWHSDEMALLEFSNFGTILTFQKGLVKFRNSSLNITSRYDNLIQKNTASFSFFYLLLYIYHQKFSKEQNSLFLERLEKAYLNDKKNKLFFINYLKIALKRRNPILVWDFLGKFGKSIYLKQKSSS
mgnify:CR=1 FL=1|tara:strand:+ start:156 stop:1067 length:912 start_codon:yes stop_codon:yes gene_type:complete